MTISAMSMSAMTKLAITTSTMSTVATTAGPVEALAAQGDRLYSYGLDGTIRAWACGTWTALRTGEATGGQPGIPHPPLHLC